ncbi:MAG: acyl-CoA dehydrogenase family protein [Rhodobacteraceae bacterium]|nr:acyl-CoA dehydrogenase family protein [Paracoccaceae bacterium]
MDTSPKAEKQAAERALVDWAGSFVPDLRAARADVDEAARTPDALAARMEDAGVWKMMVPEIYGGMHSSLLTWMRVVTELGRGDAGVAWGVTLNSACAWMAAGFYPRAVVDEVFAQPGVRLAGVFSDRAVKARPVAGGIHVDKGMWFFNSGVHQADWNMLGVPMFDAEGRPIGPGIALVPMKDVRLLDDWDPTGLRGSGSTNVAMEDLFIPAERIVPMLACIDGSHPMTFPGDPLYKAAFGPLMVLILAYPVLGAGLHMLETFVETVARRDIKLTTYARQSEAPVTHLQIGEAAARLAAARALLERACATLDDHARRDAVMPKLERAAITRDSAFANSLVWQAADLLAGAAGGSWAWSGNELNRVWQDIKVGTMHPFINAASNFEAFGGIVTGKDPAIMPFI